MGSRDSQAKKITSGMKWLREMSPITMGLSALTIGIIFASCSGSSQDRTLAPDTSAIPTKAPDSQPPRSTEVVPAPQATPGVTPTRADSSSQQTGNEDLDRIVATVVKGYTSELEALLALQSLACARAPGLGGPPSCLLPSGEVQDGTLVEVFPYSGCELEWLPRDLLSQRIAPLLPASNTGLFAAYEFSGRPSLLSDDVPPVLFAIVVEVDGENPNGVALLVGEDSKIVFIDAYCLGTASELVAGMPYDGFLVRMLEGPLF